MGFECSPYSGEDDPYEGEYDHMYDDGGDEPRRSFDDDEDDEVYDSDDEDDYQIDGVGFADPGGTSALRAETRNNPRDCTCPQCGTENVLTRIDQQRGYVCDPCADMNEGGFGQY